MSNSPQQSSFNGFSAANLIRLFGASQVPLTAPQILASTAVRQENGSFQFQVSATIGQTIVVQSSMSLAPGSWAPLWTNRLESASVLFTDPNPQSMRFYRVQAMK